MYKEMYHISSLDVVFRISDALEVPVHKLFVFRD